MSTYGERIKLTVFGESHGEAIGAVLSGVPAGYKIDMDKVLVQMARRAPGKDKTATPRLEKDFPEVKSGILNGVTTGAPIACVIENTNTKSKDYSNLLDTPRPSHSDYTAYVKYGGNNDIRGGGHFSGRLTAPIVFAGAVLRQILEEKGIKIAAHISSVADVNDKPFNPVEIDDELISKLNNSAFPLIDKSKEKDIREVVENARMNLDSVGGTIECAVVGMPEGIGGPLFEGIEGAISKAIFGIPAVKGIEFGSGFNGTLKRGSENNDAFEYKNGKVVTKTNNCGGILGGISNGMPIIFRTAVKPTPSISKEQESVNLKTGENTTLTVNGRHDPCIVPRAVPVVEAVAAIAVSDLLLVN
ncbi:MAG: chorismate synthase [Ruminococcus sp.]|nr:chorismate synthase [Ruminococcus sp.]